MAIFQLEVGSENTKEEKMGLFSTRTKKGMTDAIPYMRRIVDLTTPTLLRANESRQENRYVRGLPVALCPWVDGKPDPSVLALGFTKDLSDGGLSVLTTTELDSDEVVYSILVDTDVTSELWYFHASILRRNTAFGFLEYGMKTNGFLNENFRFELADLDSLLTTPPTDN